ncbi:hypothetical protein T484DRAFT_1950376 [Baffinella frigidus]|nr:hypothetical protein T484DRAFT_1950376 [Cryptophyta sp. CCMP2293]
MISSATMMNLSLTTPAAAAPATVTSVSFTPTLATRLVSASVGNSCRGRQQSPAAISAGTNTLEPFAEMYATGICVTSGFLTRTRNA